MRRLLPSVAPVRLIRASGALTFLAIQVSGCFQHVPVSSSVIPSGTEVSVRLTERGRVALSESVGPGVRRIIGSVLESGDTSLVLAVQKVEHSDLDAPVPWAGERVEIPRELVSEVRERQLARGRSVVVAGLVGAGAVVVSLITIATFTGGEPGPSRPPDDRDPD